MLDEDPRCMGVHRLLKTELASEKEVVELVLGNAVQERNLLGDLVDRLLHWRVLALEVHGRSQVHTHDCDTVGELLHVLPRTGHAIVVVEVAKS